MNIGRLGLVLVMLCAVSNVFAMDSKTLFYIERNKNANIVKYDINLLPDGKVDPENPFIAYWVLLAADGRKESLNFIERKYYGFKSNCDMATGSFDLAINSFKQRPFKIYNDNGDFKTEVIINNKPAYLQKVYIEGKEKFPLPSVEWIELFGINKEDNTPVREKIQI